MAAASFIKWSRVDSSFIVDVKYKRVNSEFIYIHHVSKNKERQAWRGHWVSRTFTNANNVSFQPDIPTCKKDETNNRLS